MQISQRLIDKTKSALKDNSINQYLRQLIYFLYKIMLKARFCVKLLERKY